MASVQVGHARRDITPPVGTWMAGYAARKEPCRAIHDPLEVNVVALSDGDTRIVMAAFDLCSLDLESVSSVKKEVLASAGIGPQQVMTNTSHTHAGPVVRCRRPEQFDADYFRGVLSSAAEAAAEAVEDLSPARLSVGAAPLDIGCNRRERVPEGEIILGVNREGPRLAEVTVWRFTRADASDVVLFSTPIHGTTVGPDNLEISAEWMGEARRRIEERLPEVRAVFLQGCSGNQNPYRDERTFERVARHGRTAAEAVCDALSGALDVASLPLKNVARVLQLPLDGGGSDPCPLHGVRVGDAVLVGLGGEAFVEYALFTREKSAAQSTLVLGYTDGTVGYLPTAAAYAEGGYEPNAFKWMPGKKPWDPGLEAMLKEEIVRLLAELSREL